MSGTAVIVLAAGSSSRLGSPKQLVAFAGTTLVHHACDVALQAAVGPVYVVLGSSLEQTRAQLAGLDVIEVVNEDWPEGMASSIRAGVAAASAHDSCLVMTCDQPAVTASHLRALAEGGRGSADGIGASSYEGTAGIPAFFERRHFAALLALSGDRGAKSLIAGARAAFMARLPGGGADVDRPGDVRMLEQ